MKILITIIIVVLLILFVGIVFIRRKRTALLNAEKKNIREIERIIKQTDEQLDKINEISKTDEMQKIHELLIRKRNASAEGATSYRQAVSELEEANGLLKDKEFSNKYGEVRNQYSDLLEQTREMAEKVKHFAEIGEKNSELSITIKSRLKKVNNEFDKNLRMYEIHNGGFNEQVLTIKEKVNSFNTYQNEGDYRCARQQLIEANDIVERISETTSFLSVAYASLDELKETERDIHVIIDQIKEEGYQVKVRNFDTLIEEFHVREENILANLSQIDYGLANEQSRKEITLQIESLRGDIDKINTEIGNQFGYIKELMTLESENEELIEQVRELLKKAKLECESVKYRYALTEMKQVKSLEEIGIKFNHFLEDYSKLTEVVHEAKESHEDLVVRTRKSNLYLRNVLSMIVQNLNEIRNLRADELHAFEVVKEVPLLQTEIDLYLRRNHHLNKQSSSLSKKIMQLEELEREIIAKLEVDHINIIDISSQTEELEKVCRSLVVEKAVENDVLQALGVEYLIEYIGRFRGADYDQKLEQLCRMYNGGEYETALRMAHQILEDKNPGHGAEMYKKITSHVSAQPFDFVLKPIKSEEETQVEEINIFEE